MYIVIIERQVWQEKFRGGKRIQYVANEIKTLAKKSKPSPTQQWFISNYNCTAVKTMNGFGGLVSLQSKEEVCQQSTLSEVGNVNQERGVSVPPGVLQNFFVSKTFALSA